ncbi:MAG TPA: BofC C-terminal domain-containing protein [Calditerricola sp.]
MRLTRWAFKSGREGRPKRKRWLFLAVTTILLAAGLGYGAGALVVAIEGWVNKSPAPALVAEVVLKRIYVDGYEEETRETVTLPSEAALVERYRDWTLVEKSARRYVFERHIKDISPVTKARGYFGLLDGSILAIFGGPPDEGEVIHTFYPLDVKRMESSLPPEELAMLQRGIRVTNLAEYNSILSTFGEFALEE